ncbi:MAG: malate synthase A [Proteobacteria bacterium]|nr:malate synthase A [Pseudomonadota bacterium]
MSIKITAPPVKGQETILTPAALDFLASLEKKFGARRRALLDDRCARQRELDKTGTLDFPAETAGIRAADWSVRPAPDDLQDRRVEITGPVDRKMVINALNSGASGFMADFEDSNTPTWSNQINGQINLLEANHGTIHFSDPATGKDYRLKDKVAVLMVRPRGLHMEEKHATLGGKYLSAAFFDFGLYLFHNRRKPYFYLPKLESYHEARLWNDVLVYAEDFLGLARGTVRVTVLIETITASFQMDEILSELRDHIVGLNCGRWDYIFSFIKRFANHPDRILPDRGDVTMTCHFLRSYSLNLIKTCHRRKAHAMGGMAAQIPIKNDEEANRIALEKFVADKTREAADGHDGTWVAHPGLVQKAKEIFDHAMPGPHQLGKMRPDVTMAAEDLLAPPPGVITEAGLRRNINVGLLYLRSWLGGNGCVPIYNMMEDAATAEISRTQLWQWRRHKARLQDGRVIDDALMQSLLKEEGAKMEEDRYLRDAVTLFQNLVMAPVLEEFLTTPAYDVVLGYERE